MKRALVVRGGWEGHFPVEATELFLPFLRDEGYDVRVADTPEVYASLDPAETDLVVQCVTMGQASDAAVAGLRAAVAAGTGLAGWHGGIVDSFRASSDYVQLVGGQFAAHPTGADGAHPTHTIEPLPAAAEHPITAGIGPFELTTEQYWVLTDELCDVLAVTTHAAPEGQPWHRPVTCPAVWTRQWGAGRIAVVTPGHDPATLSVPEVRTLVERSLLWASR
ncbi:MAG: ThuA domain-containing protein [Arachnia sp.]